MGSIRNMRASLNLASHYENIVLAERTLSDLLDLAGLGGEYEYWLVTAVREAVANAMRHGHQENAALLVRIEMAIDGDELSIGVADEGNGFNPEDVPDPTDPENLLKPCGRGIFYMNRFMDMVRFSQSPRGGTLVEMTRKITRGHNKENTQ